MVTITPDTLNLNFKLQGIVLDVGGKVVVKPTPLEFTSQVLSVENQGVLIGVAEQALTLQTETVTLDVQSAVVIEPNALSFGLNLEEDTLSSGIGVSEQSTTLSLETSTAEISPIISVQQASLGILKPTVVAQYGITIYTKVLNANLSLEQAVGGVIIPVNYASTTNGLTLTILPSTVTTATGYRFVQNQTLDLSVELIKPYVFNTNAPELPIVPNDATIVQRYLELRSKMKIHHPFVIATSAIDYSELKKLDELIYRSKQSLSRFSKRQTDSKFYGY